MIAIDWGTSSFRAARLNGGTVTDRIEGPWGILTIADAAFAGALRQRVGPWLAAGETRIILSGMIGSRQGWVEATYLPCPADPAALAAATIPVPFEGATVRIVPGLSATDSTGVPDVMRGEETQLLGVWGGADGVACLPGSHSKWVTLARGSITGFSTYLSGETFAALRGHTILGRLMADGPVDGPAFDRGVARSGEPGHLLHHLFGVRTLGLFNRLPPAQAASFLSGLLIGHEVRAALPADADILLIGAPSLCALYARAITAAAGTCHIAPEDAALRGLARIGETLGWT